MAAITKPSNPCYKHIRQEIMSLVGMLAFSIGNREQCMVDIYTRELADKLGQTEEIHMDIWSLTSILNGLSEAADENESGPDDITVG